MYGIFSLGRCNHTENDLPNIGKDRYVYEEDGANPELVIYKKR